MTRTGRPSRSAFRRKEDSRATTRSVTPSRSSREVAFIVKGERSPEAKPSPVLEERLNHALDLYRDGYAKTLIFTGGYGTGARFPNRRWRAATRSGTTCPKTRS